MSEIIASEIDELEEYDNGIYEKHASLYNKLLERCEVANIPCVKLVGESGKRRFALSFPSGREKRQVNVWTTQRVESILAIPFEKYTFLSGFRAICSYEDGVIEAGIRYAGIGPVSVRMVLDGLTDKSANKESAHFKLLNEDKGVSIRIGYGTAPFEALMTHPTISLSISGLKVSQHDQAIDYLVRISNAIFFEVDLSLKLPIALIRERPNLQRGRAPSRRGEPLDLQFPRSEYDEAAMSLYWYARSASGMPLLQFLAYYQTVEFYFPAYSEIEAQRRIQNILKDPTFNPYKIADISKLLTMFKSNTSRGFGDELAQLSATIRECLDPQALWTFLTEDDSRKEALSKGKLLAKQKLPLADKYTDAREQVANRIYEIRCKVVHTKNDSRETELDLLLPFSKEAESLDYDIDLIQYVAQQVLIASSRPLQI